MNNEALTSAVKVGGLNIRAAL